MQGRNTVCLPLSQHPGEPARFVTLEILHRFEFDAEFMMSGVIARSPSAKHQEPQVFLKGSPHAVVQLVAHNRLPENWVQVTAFVYFVYYYVFDYLLLRENSHRVIKIW